MKPLNYSLCLAIFSLLALHHDSSAVWAQAPSVQEGDLFVGAASGTALGVPRPDGPRGVFRVRDGVVTPFSLGPADRNDPGFFDVPHDVIVDSQGRVVWLAPVDVVDLGTFGTHVGLFRASGEGASPERLAIFRVGNQPLDPGYPNPFPDLQLVQYDNGSGAPPVIGLHLASNRRIEIDDDIEGGKPRVVTEESYVMGLLLGTGTTDFAGARTVSYGATTGVWDDHLPDPIHQLSPPAVPLDMVSHAGAIYSIHGNGLRRSSTPLRLSATGTIDLGDLGEIDFTVGLGLFGGNHDVRALIVDDTNIPNVPCNCAPDAPDPPHHLIPSEPGYSPMSGFQSLHYDPSLGLVISSNTGFLGPYLTQINETLLNDSPDDDLDAYFYWPEAGDLPTPSLGITRLVAKHQFGDPDSGIAYPVNRSVIGAPDGGGLVGLSPNGVVGVQADGSAEVLATGLFYPSSIGSYPTYSSPSTGLSVIIRVDSPVDVLLTAPDGRRIGVDPQTGLPVNDFGESGFDGGPGEPRFFAVNHPTPGDWDIDFIGTGDGPFAINVYGIDLDQPIGSLARMTGTASMGARGSAILTIQSDGGVALVPEPTALALACSGVVLLLGRRLRKTARGGTRSDGQISLQEFRRALP